MTEKTKERGGHVPPRKVQEGGSAGLLGPYSWLHVGTKVQSARAKAGGALNASVHSLYDDWSVTFIPLADRLNRNPPVCECSLMTTPFSFLRYATEPPSNTVRPAVTAE